MDGAKLGFLRHFDKQKFHTEMFDVPLFSFPTLSTAFKVIVCVCILVGMV